MTEKQIRDGIPIFDEINRLKVFLHILEKKKELKKINMVFVDGTVIDMELEDKQLSDLIIETIKVHKQGILEKLHAEFEKI